MTSFLDATAVTAAAPDRYDAHVDPEFNVPVGVHGGVLAATTLRAACEALERDDLHLHTAHGSFLARPDGQDLTIATRQLRAGRTTGHVDADAASPGTSTVALATRSLFTRSREGIRRLDACPPDVPPPQDCPADGTGDDASPLSRPPLFDQLEVRRAAGTYPWAPDWEPGLPLRYARWSRWRTTPTRPDGSYDPLALLPPADLPGPSVWVAYAPDEPLRLLVSLELTVHFLEEVRDQWVLADFRARWLDRGYVLSECDLWSDGRLVAQSTQTMMLRTADTGG